MISPRPFGCTLTVDNRSLRNPDIRREAHYIMARNLAQSIIEKMVVEQTVDEYCTTFRAEVFVLKPGEFYRIVQEEASKYALGRPMFFSADCQDS